MNTLLWKRRLGRLYPTPSPKERRVILIYHAVGRGPEALASDRFVEQVQWLKNHCEVVPLDMILNTSKANTKIQVALTFDDGYESVYRLAAPILAQEKMPATAYLNTGWIADSINTRKASRVDLGHTAGENFMIWDEVQALVRQGWEIGSHGVEHLDLTQQSLETIKTELRQSKKDIELRLHKECAHFCYTWGRYHPALKQAVAEAGYRSAVAAHHAPMTVTEDRFALPRLHVANEYTMADFEHIVNGKWDFLNLVQRVKKVSSQVIYSR